MSSTLSLLLQITATNGAAGILNGVRKSLVDMGRLGKESARHFDAMTRSLQKAGTAFAAAAFLHSKLKPGVQAAADLEEAMNRVKGNISQIGDKADDLADKLKKVRDTGREVSKVMPYSAKEVVDIQGALLKSGVDIEAVVGARGAAYAAAGLASVSGVDPGQVGDLLARVGKQYDFKPQDYKGAADLLMKGEAASPGSLQELMYSLKQSGATAKLLGVSFKDAVTMSAAMAPLGLESGTAINRYILDSAGLTKHQREAMVELGLARMHDGNFENLLYKGGTYIGLDAQNAMVREKLGAIPDDRVKLKLAHDIWGQEGMRAGLMVGSGNDIFAEMQKQMNLSLGLEERMKIVMDGFNMSAKAAAGTIQTLLATAFTPALQKASALANTVNDLADAGAQWLGKHPTGNSLVAGAGMGLVAGAAGYGAWNLLKGGASGMKLLKGIAGTGAGIATGKAVEAATGVQPVFVTNWPGGAGGVAGGLAADAASAAGGAAAGGIAGKAVTGSRALLTMARALPLAAWGTMGLAGFGTAAAGVGAAGVAGYGAGTVINMGINALVSAMTKKDETLGGWIHDLIHKEKEPIKVEVSVVNGNIVAAVNEANVRRGLRY